MRDGYERNITYLRLSVTDLCSLRCRYCMPPEGVPKRDHGDICSVEELVENAVVAGQPFLSAWADARIETIF